MVYIVKIYKIKFCYFPIVSPVLFIHGFVCGTGTCVCVTVYASLYLISGECHALRDWEMSITDIHSPP